MEFTALIFMKFRIAQYVSEDICTEFFLYLTKNVGSNCLVKIWLPSYRFSVCSESLNRVTRARAVRRCTKTCSEMWKLWVNINAMKWTMTVADPFFTKITLSRERYVNCYTEFHENPSDCLVVDIRFKDGEHGLNAGFFFARCGGLVIERDWRRNRFVVRQNTEIGSRQKFSEP